MKIIRILFSVVFFTLYFFLFLRLLEISELFGDYLPFLQIFPGILKFIAAFSISSSAILVILVFSLVFGRWYCSLLCPLGTLQDFFIFIRKKLFRKKSYFYHKPLSTVHFGFLILSMSLFASGFDFLILYSEPFSIFGRITTNLFRPIINLANNNLSYFLNHTGISILKPMTEYSPGFPVFIYSALFFFLLGFLSFFRGRLYCNLICPTGALLRLTSKIQLYSFRIDKNNCTHCGICSKICRSECIDTVLGNIDASRCVCCMDCLDACPSKAVGYNLKLNKTNISTNDMPLNSRRNFIKTSVKTFASFLPLVVLPVISHASVYSKFLPFRKKEPVMPPGAESRRLFTERCTACNLCTAVCPNQIIRPSVLEYGLVSVLQPRLDYDRGYCLFECTRCTEVCPAGALKKLTENDKAIKQIGRAFFIKENCIVYRKETSCTACSEHCPTKAVDVVPYKKKGLFAPVVDQAVCVGCGACEYACPVNPKAIYVEGLLIHSAAKKKEIKPASTDSNKIRKNSEDFPF